MNGLPQDVFQNHMVHHPLLQYQMLFPSLLLSIAKPPSDDFENIVDHDGKVNPVDHLRFSALANQLAITQINQVLMDLVKDTTGDDLKKLKESQNAFMQLVRDGVSQLNDEMTRSKTVFENNNKLLGEQDKKLVTLQDVTAKGLIDSLSKIVNVENSVKNLSNNSASSAKELHGMLISIGDRLTKVHDVIGNITDDSLCCYDKGASPQLDGILPATPAPLLSQEILTGIQEEIRNLSKTLTEFIVVTKSKEEDKDMIKVLIEKCSNASIGETEVDLSNITKAIEEGLATNTEIIRSPLRNISEGFGHVTSEVLKTRTDLKEVQDFIIPSLSKSEVDLQNLTTFTLLGFQDLASKIDDLFNRTTTVDDRKEKTKCPEQYFPIDDECFYVTTSDEVSFEEASNNCQHFSSKLAQPKSLLKFLSVMETLPYNKSIELWMGGKKTLNKYLIAGEASTSEQVWIWIDSEIEIDHGWKYRRPLENGECLKLSKNGLKDGDCEDFKGYVCQTIPLP